jgi:hypothetical protein
MDITNPTSFAEWLSLHPRALQGREDGEDDGSSTAVVDDDSAVEDDLGTGDDGGSGDDSGTGESNADDGNGDGSGTADDEGDVDDVDRVREERDAARRELAAAQAAVQRAKAEARKAREDAAKKGGNWEQVAKDRLSDLEENAEKLQSAETRAVTAEQNLDDFRREVRVTRVASKLSFRDPEDAIKLVSPESVGDDKATERTLRKLVEDKPYLVDQRRATGRSMGNGNNGGGITMAQIKNMTQDEINTNWEQVQKVMAASGQGTSG